MTETSVPEPVRRLSIEWLRGVATELQSEHNGRARMLGLLLRFAIDGHYEPEHIRAVAMDVLRTTTASAWAKFRARQILRMLDVDLLLE